MYTNNSSSYHSVYRSLPSSGGGGGPSTVTPSVSGAWNGSSWISNNNNANNINISLTSSSPPPLPSTELPRVPDHMAPLDPKSTPVADLVTHFSAIYQHYSQQVSTFKARNDTKSSGYQWAEYYADLSTRAAHHYNDLLQKQKAAAGSNSGSSGYNTNTNTSPYRQHGHHQQKHQHQNQGHKAPPKSFQKYAHKNLSRCVNDTQKSAMTELIQLTIKKSLQNGTMHTTQWQQEPLLPLPGAVTSASATVAAAGTAMSSSSNSFSSSHYNNNNNSSSHSSYNSSSDQNNGKSYLEALKSSNSSSRGSNSNSSGDTHNYYGRQSSNDSTTSSSIASKRKRGVLDMTKKNNKETISESLSTYQSKKKRLDSSTSNYDDALPVNDSYYGSHHSANLGVVKSSNNFDSNQETYFQELPANDSYYGRGNSGSTTSSASLSNIENFNPTTGTPSKYKKKKKKVTSGGSSSGSPDKSIGSTETSTAQFQFGDYISLSSLSTDKYIAKNNKLIKVNKSKSPEASVGKKKNVIQGAVKSNKSKLASRLNRFSGAGGIAHATSSQLHSAYSQGTEQFMGKSVIGGSSKKLDEEDYESMTVKGTCQVLEKEYLRLTAPPRAELVRPQGILEKHLRNLKNQWKQYRQVLTSGKVNNDYNSNDSKKKKKKKQRDYNWFCSQLKAIRQDLTVQRIFNAFAVEVYETHAKIALEEGDMNEYNQSQTQLKELYDILTHSIISSSGDDESLIKGLQNQNEFIAYRIIYYVFLTGNKKYDGGSSDLFKIMLGLSKEQRKDPCIDHALKVRIAVADNDYHSFFRLQDHCPNSGAYLMDMMIGQIRAIGLQCMMKSYRPTLPVAFILEELGFAFNGNLDVEEGTSWLKSCGCKLNEDDSLVNTKDSVLTESNLIGKNSSSLI